MRRSYRKIFGSALAGVSALALTLPAAPVAFAAASKSAAGVARISNVTGGVDVRRSGVGGNYAAALNAPVSVGDYIATQRNGRSEVEFDHAMTLRLAPATQVRFIHLTPDDHEVQLAQGTVELRLFHSTNGHPVVETPSASIRPVEAGRYRVTVDADGKTTVSVRSGRVDVTAPNGSDPYLGVGQSVEAYGYGRSERFRDRHADAYDSFDGWCDGRDDGWSHVSNWSYDDGGMVGVNDMTDYGRWSNDPQYGQVWTPGDVSSNWSPYSDGQYVWDPNYGWTWVGDEPWGYAPYHYGRWFHRDRGWGWAPGGYDDGDAYAYQPAVVGFFALGAGVGVDFSIGDVGWVPLAPGEPYYPWWNGGGGYDGNGWNGGNNDNVGYAGNYRNARYGAVGVSGSNFANGDFAHARRYNRSQLGQARAIRGAVPVVPTSRNLAFNSRQAAPVRNFASSRNFTRMAAPSVAHVAFANQRTAVAAIARKQHPTYATSIARQVKAPGRGAGFTDATVARKAGAARPGVATRAKPATSRRTAGVAAPHAGAARPAQVTRKARVARPAVAMRTKPKAAAPHAATGVVRTAAKAPKRAANAAPRANAARAAASAPKARAAAAPVVHHAAAAPIVHAAAAPVVVHHAYAAPVVHAAPRMAAPAPRAAPPHAAPAAAAHAAPAAPAHAAPAGKPPHQ